MVLQVLDCLTAEIDRRFSEKNCEIMEGVQSLDPKSSSFLKEKPLLALGKTFESDLEDLKHELHQTRRLLLRREKSGERPATLLYLSLWGFWNLTKRFSMNFLGLVKFWL